MSCKPGLAPGTGAPQHQGQALQRTHSIASLSPWRRLVGQGRSNPQTLTEPWQRRPARARPQLIALPRPLAGTRAAPETLEASPLRSPHSQLRHTSRKICGLVVAPFSRQKERRLALLRVAGGSAPWAAALRTRSLLLYATWAHPHEQPDAPQGEQA